LFQFSLFIGSYEIRHAFPFTCQVVFCVSVLIQLWQQSKIEKKINITEKKSDDLVGLIARATLAWLLGAIAYIGIVLLCMRSSIWLAEAIHASTNLSTGLFFFGGIFGVMLGLAINYALAPIHVKKVLPTSLLSDSLLQSQLETCFQKAGLKIPRFWIIELNQFHVAHTIAAGFQNGRGSLRPALFISRALLTSLPRSEFEAVILNQVSHIALRHLRKRFLLAFGLILFTTFIAIGSVVCSKLLGSEQGGLEMIGPAFALACFFFSFRLMSDQIKRQQLEADVYSVEKLGVNLDDLVQSLRKLDRPDEKPTPKQGYPDTERRIHLLQLYFKSIQPEEASKSSNNESKAS
jgi:Zn-dependent protease with chaperone function